MRDTRVLEREINALPSLGLEELRARWSALFGRPAPKSFRRKFLARAIAHQMQVAAYGGLSDATKRKLRLVAESASAGIFDPATIGARIKPGTKLVRTWHGETHTVLALEDGFSWKGTQHYSLSAIAKAITGTNWNGWKFFGLKGAAPGEGRDVLGRFNGPAVGASGAPTWPRSRKAIVGAKAGAAAHA